VCVKAIIFAASLALPWAATVSARAQAGTSPATGPDIASIAASTFDATSRDPTENVKALTAAGLKTQEELRIALKELLQSKLDGIEKLSELRYQQSVEITKSAIESAGDRRNAELRRIDQVDKLRADMNDKLASAERDRINAMRLLDVGAAADLQRRTSESAAALQARTDTLATDLRTQTALLAENLRTLVLNTASQQAMAQKQAADEISKHLSTIDSALSEGRGKQTVSDPALVALVTEVQKLSQSRTDQAGVGQGRSDVVGWAVAGIMMLIALGGLVIVVVGALRHRT